MKSRITIEVNFEDGNLPVIQISQMQSDDVRDRLIQNFLQSLQHTSRWCKIIYMGNRSVYNPKVAEIDHIHVWNVVPLTPNDLPVELKLIEETVALAAKREDVFNNIADIVRPS